MNKRYFLETSFADQLASFKNQLWLTPKELCSILELSNKTVNDWVSGKVTPHILTQEGAIARLQAYWRCTGRK